MLVPVIVTGITINKDGLILKSLAGKCPFLENI